MMLDVTTTTPHERIGSLGRIYHHDLRNGAYPLLEITKPVPPKIRKKHWNLGPQLDQALTPKCVGASGRQWLTMTPIRFRGASPDLHECYAGAQRFDGIPYPHDGSNANGLMGFFQERGLVKSYHWASAVEEGVNYVLSTGPILVGSDWLGGMFYPDPAGIVWPTGAIAGGHEYVWCGVDLDENAAYFDNSWNVTWNAVMKGQFKIKLPEFSDFINRYQGDLCAAVEASVFA